ncbi:MAG: hypothetical protein EP330_02950 [Deltaproteobacteria bacterium]|nr:MAG: hypothetical protein EP330_02950 [Deltaproteobacteria bacterium]
MAAPAFAFKACPEGLSTAEYETVRVPLDRARPDGEVVHLEVRRLPVQPARGPLGFVAGA